MDREFAANPSKLDRESLTRLHLPPTITIAAIAKIKFKLSIEIRWRDRSSCTGIDLGGDRLQTRPRVFTVFSIRFSFP
ncbi:MAG: hypothetical protein D6680_04120 [Cyanobacteria bacterium J007]|nr:MAG: hypothetical protein D6680_04120 [Cyanobacteria bacterium J007]